MRGVTGFLLLGLFVAGCRVSDGTPGVEPPARDGPREAPPSASIIPTLRPVGDRGFFALSGPFASFDPNHASVEVWAPRGVPDAPIMVYAHGGAGYREDDRARVEMFRRNGFATISFDAYEMNGFTDWEFVTRRVTNGGKQDMIWGVFQGAAEHAAAGGAWDAGNILLYGGSNGGRVVLYAGTELGYSGIRGIISEAPAATGSVLGDLSIPTIIPFGALDNWAGQSETDYVWTRTYPNSPISIEAWVRSLQEKQRPVRFIFYENAGHLLFEGPLKEVTVRRGESVAFTAYEGAGPGVLEQYERDVMSFVDGVLRR
jgi:dienelactone hydrolase